MVNLLQSSTSPRIKFSAAETVKFSYAISDDDSEVEEPEGAGVLTSLANATRASKPAPKALPAKLTPESPGWLTVSFSCILKTSLRITCLENYYVCYRVAQKTFHSLV